MLPQILPGFRVIDASGAVGARIASRHHVPPGCRPPRCFCEAGAGPQHMERSLEPCHTGPGRWGRRPGADAFQEAQVLEASVVVVGGCPWDRWPIWAAGNETSQLLWKQLGA